MAVHKKRAEIVQLLFDRGADARSIHFGSVMMVATPEIAQMLVDRGADIASGYPVALPLVRSPREWIGFCKELLPTRPELMFQVNMALRNFCRQDNLPGVCLAL